MADRKVGGDVVAALWVAGLLTLAGVAIDNMAAGMLLTIVVYLVLAYAASRVPLRHSLLTMMLLALTLENPAENPGSGVWRSPFFTVGAIVLTHVNTVTGIRALSFSGMDMAIGGLLALLLARRLGGSKVDSAGRTPTPRPLVRLAQLSFAGTAFCVLRGLVSGGQLGMAVWQVDRVMYLPLVFLLFHLGLRGSKDLRALGKVILGAAVFKALLALWVTMNVRVDPDPNTGSTRLPCATTHHDSILFACAFVACIALLMERTEKSLRRTALSLIPVLMLGMWANNRRMAWVQVGLVFVAVYFATHDNAFKRKLRRVLALATPFAIGYVAAGWNSTSGVFKPVKMIRSIVEPTTDGSTLWREFENYNLISTFRHNPLAGVGYGIPYFEIIPMPEIPYPLERYAPHNSVLGLWAYGGYLGWTAMTLLWGAGAYFAMRAYHGTKDPLSRAAAIVCFGAVLVYMIQCWGDMGLGTWTGVFLLGSMLAMGGKLAVEAKQWPGTATRKHFQARSSVPPRPVRGTEQAA